MNSILLTLIAFKLVCLFVCWKGMAMAKKENQKPNKKSKIDHSSVEWQEAQTRMDQLMEQNKQLSDAIQKIKSTDSKPFYANKKESI